MSSKGEQTVLEKEQKMLKHLDMTFQEEVGDNPATWSDSSVPKPPYTVPAPFWPPGPFNIHQPMFTPPLRPRFRQASPNKQNVLQTLQNRAFCKQLSP